MLGLYAGAVWIVHTGNAGAGRGGGYTGPVGEVGGEDR